MSSKPGPDFQALFAATPTPLLVIAPDAPRFTIVDVNDAFSRAALASRDALLGHGLFEAFPEGPDNTNDPPADGVASLRASLDRVLERRAPDAMPTHRVVVARSDGVVEERFWRRLSAPVVDAAGRISAIVQHVEDVTAQHVTEQRLRASAAHQSFLLALEDRLRAASEPRSVLADSARAVGEQLRAGRVHYVEFDETISRFSISDDWTDGHSPSLMGGGTTAAFGMDFFDALALGSTIVVDDVRTDPRTHRSADAYLAVSAAAILAVPRVREGRLVAALSVDYAAPRAWTPDDVALLEEVADRTWAAFEQARAEHGRRQAEERYLALFNAIDQGFCTIEVAFDDHAKPIDYRFLEVSPSFERQTGIANAAGRWMREIAPDQDEHWFELYGRVATTGEPIRFENHSTPLARWWSVYAFRVQAPELRRVGLLFFEITERKQAEDALRESDRRKDEFLAMLAHELRNPLAPLTNAHRLIERTQSLDERGRGALALAGRQTRQLTRLVDDLLEVSRVSRGKIELRREPMMAGLAVQQAAKSQRAAIEARDQALQVIVPPTPARIDADPARITQVLENLLVNASKFSPAGSVIRLEVELHADMVEIRVVDQGVGIEPAKIAQLFVLFHQIDATIERSQGGLGIGLALVKRLVELHGGTVSARSEGLGRGSTFSVRLPRMPSPEGGGAGATA